jgi:hypothetical protein
MTFYDQAAFQQTYQQTLLVAVQNFKIKQPPVTEQF